MSNFIALLTAFWASNKGWIITLVIVPLLGWVFTRLTVFTSSSEWDSFKSQHPWLARIIVLVRTYGPDASKKVLERQGVVLVDTTQLPPEVRASIGAPKVEGQKNVIVSIKPEK